jgi:trehalose-6-phosphate synthase
MPEAEVERRMRSLRATVAAHTVHDWADGFLRELGVPMRATQAGASPG